MKNKHLILILIWILISAFLLQYSPYFAHADGLTLSMIGATSYALMTDWGISFGAGNATGAGMQDFMTTQVQNYVNSQGGDIASLFGNDLAVSVAGQLVAGQQLVNGIIDFTQWLSQVYTLDTSDLTLNVGTYNGTPMGPKEGEKSWSGSGVGAYFVDEYTYPTGEGPFYSECRFMNGSSQVYSASPGSGFWFNGSYTVYYENSAVYVSAERCRKNGTLISPLSHAVATRVTSLDNSLTWNGTNYVEPTVLNPNQEWVGDFGLPSDTNIDQLIDTIFGEVADNNLAVDGEVIDIPVPPEPVPTWIPVDDVIDGINQTGEMLEGIGNDIGDISGHLDDIGEQVDGIEQSLEGVQEGIQTQTGVISGAIDQATSDVVDAIGEQTATLDQSLTDTAEGVQEIAEALQPGEIEPKKFDLRGLFPFCIPFDIHNLLQKFQAAPVAPHVQLPFVIQSIGFSYTFDLDFSAFDSVAAVMRTVEYIVFAIGLAWATSKVIKW